MKAAETSGLVELSVGDAQAAHEVLAPFAQMAIAADVSEPGQWIFLPDEIEALVRLGELDQAGALLEPFAAHSHQLGRRRRLAIAAGAAMMAAAAAGCESVPAGSGRAGSPGTSATGGQRPVVWLASVQMTSAATGWALRFTGYPGSRLPVGLLSVRTTDGGRRWYDVAPLPAGSTPVVLDAVTASRAWLAVTARSLTFVLFTSNGGVTWAKSVPVGPGGPAALSFSDTVHGWLLQSLGAATGSAWVALYRSVDSGLRWSLVAQTPPPPTYGTSRGGLPTGCDKTGVTFRSPRTGWLTGACAAGDFVLVSTDAGLRWSPQRLPVTSPGCLDGCFINPPQFIGRTGFLTFSHYPAVAYLLVSTDGGARWQPRRLPAGAGPYPQIRFFSPRQGIIVPAGAQGTFGRVFYVTANGGKTWTAVPQGRRFTELGAGVDFVSTRTGYAWINGADVTSVGPPDMYETTNSGVTWQPFAPGWGKPAAGPPGSVCLDSPLRTRGWHVGATAKQLAPAGTGSLPGWPSAGAQIDPLDARMAAS